MLVTEQQQSSEGAPDQQTEPGATRRLLPDFILLTMSRLSSVGLGSWSRPMKTSGSASSRPPGSRDHQPDTPAAPVTAMGRYCFKRSDGLTACPWLPFSESRATNGVAATRLRCRFRNAAYGAWRLLIGIHKHLTNIFYYARRAPRPRVEPRVLAQGERPRHGASPRCECGHASCFLRRGAHNSPCNGFHA